MRWLSCFQLLARLAEEQDDASSSVLALAAVDQRYVVAGSANGLLRSGHGWHYKHPAPIWSLCARGQEVVLGDGRGGVWTIDAKTGAIVASWPRQLSGWVRASCLDADGGVLAVGCNLVHSERCTGTFDAGPTTADEEPWRRHDILSIASMDGQLYAGLVDGSLRRWGTDRTLAAIPRAHGGRVIAIGAQQGAVTSISRDGCVARWNADLSRKIASFDARATLTAAAFAEDVIIVADEDRNLLVLDDRCRLRRRAQLACRVSSLLATSTPPRLPGRGERPTESREDGLFAVAGFADGSLATYLLW